MQPAVAYDVKMDKLVLLKDTWHLLLDGIEPEGQTYAHLHENKVPNIPHCLLACDVGDVTYHQTQTHRFTDKYWPNPLKMYIVPHRHYHLILDTISTLLWEFTCTRQVVAMVHASLKGKLTKS